MAALNDMFAAASAGVYPTPTPTLVSRYAYAVSYGLLNVMPGYRAYRALWFFGFIGGQR